MALPTVKINNSTGDNVLASGAGPATAITGTKARGRNATSGRIGFFEASAPDLSGVATDGSHVLYMQGATRKFSKITASKNTSQSVTGDMLITQSTVTNTTTTGMTAGDCIRVTGAGSGGADLYSTIASVTDATTLTLNDSASTSVTGNAVANPKQVTVEDTFDGTADRNWAIGGKRKDFENGNSDTKQLFTDFKPGWTVDIEEAGANYNLNSSSCTIGTSGDATNGKITIKSSSATRPTITSTTASQALFTMTATTFLFFDHLKLTHGGTPRGDAFSAALSSNSVVRDCVIDGCAVGARIGGSSVFLVGCEIINCTSTTAGAVAAASGSIVGCYLGNNSGDAVRSSGTATCSIVDTIFYKNGVSSGTGSGIHDASTSQTMNFTITNCTFIENQTAGFKSDNSTGSVTLHLWNNIFWGDGTNTAYGVNIVTLTQAANDARQAMNRNNAYGNHVTGARNNWPAGTGDVTLTSDPFYKRATEPNGDYTVSVGSGLRAAAFPTQYLGSNTNYLDIGAVQHRENLPMIRG